VSAMPFGRRIFFDYINGGGDRAYFTRKGGNPRRDHDSSADSSGGVEVVPVTGRVGPVGEVRADTKTGDAT
jgi:hypothetical protein